MQKKKWVISMGASMMALAPFTAITTLAHAATTTYVETNHGWVDYHSGPALKSSISGRLTSGEKAQLIKKTNAYWYEVRVNGKIAYITTSSNFTHLVNVTTNSSSSSTRSSSQDIMTNHGWVTYFSEPRLSSSKLGRLQLGQRAALVRKYNAYWYEVKINGQTVYITTSSSFVHVVGASTASIPGASTSTSPTTGVSTSSAWKTQADAVVRRAKTQLGVPYLWGKQLPGVGFDCSNFTAWAFRQAIGVSFTGASQRQRDSVGTPVALSNIREGDLLFFKTKHNATGGGHVGIYLGGGQVIQEGGGWGKVTIEPLAGTWLGRNLVFARRVIH